MLIRCGYVTTISKRPSLTVELSIHLRGSPCIRLKGGTGLEAKFESNVSVSDDVMKYGQHTNLNSYPKASYGSEPYTAPAIETGLFFIRERQGGTDV